MRIRLKQFIPTNLFGRALLILVLPMLISQLVIAHVFLDRHWGSVSRNLAGAAVGDLTWVHTTYQEEHKKSGHEAALGRAEALAQQLGVAIDYHEVRTQRVPSVRQTRQFADLYQGLSERITGPIQIRYLDESNEVAVDTDVRDGMLTMRLNRKAVTSPTTRIFLIWMAGSALILTLVAIAFLRNQIRPIVTLARAAEQFGLGQEVMNFRPRGASEVRRAGRAFAMMAERIRRQVQNRTEMLAGISHDLRTPLTRMKLALEMAKIDAATRGSILADIDEMGKMIDEYLDFARGDAGETPEPIDLNLLIKDVVDDYRRSKRAVHYTPVAAIELMLRPQAMRRALTNLIDNALRYGGGEAEVALEPSATFVRIKITDRGPGIPEAEHETVFKPFTRLEPSRNNQTGGVGLGLSIARTIAQSHGGDVTLENRRHKRGKIEGLEATLRLPRAVQN